MQLKALSIRRAESWESKKGFIGTLTCKSPNSETTITLSEEACRQILIVAGGGIKEAAAETARFLEDEATRLEQSSAPWLASVNPSTDDDLPF
jgi:hypothetical protein